MTVATITVLDALAAQQLVNCLPGLGQALMASSLPVTIASNQGALTTNSTVVAALPAGANVIGAVTQSGPWNITNISGTISLPTGASTSANQTAINTAVGSTSDAVVANGASGTALGYLRTMKDAATSTAPSAVNIDQTTPGTTNRVALPELTAAANVAKTYTGMFTVAGTALTRPANVTAYSIGDSISNNGTAASVTTTAVALSDTNDHPVDLVEILLDTADTGPGTAAATIRLHLYNADYTASSGVQAGDNATRSQKKNGWVGSFSGAMAAFFDGSRGRLIADVGNLLVALPATGTKNYYWELEARTAFTPSANSTTFTPTFKGFQARPA